MRMILSSAADNKTTQKTKVFLRWVDDNKIYWGIDPWQPFWTSTNYIFPTEAHCCHYRTKKKQKKNHRVQSHVITSNSHVFMWTDVQSYIRTVTGQTIIPQEKEKFLWTTNSDALISFSSCIDTLLQSKTATETRKRSEPGVYLKALMFSPAYEVDVHLYWLVQVNMVLQLGQQLP